MKMLPLPLSLAALLASFVIFFGNLESRLKYEAVLGVVVVLIVEVI